MVKRDSPRLELAYLPAGEKDLVHVRDIAYRTWPATFGGIMPKVLIAHLLSSIYEPEALRYQRNELQHTFLLMKIKSGFAGFVSYESRYEGRPELMVHKFYILPEFQGKGLGGNCLDQLAIIARDQKLQKLRLHVYFENVAAIKFYLKYGFVKTGIHERKTEIGYDILDYVMEKPL